jgi:hypothetical protein
MLKKVLFLSFAIISATTFSFAQVSGGGGSSPKKKPIAPTSITAVAPNIDTQSEGSTSNVVVSWTDNATNETGYYAQAFWQNTGLPVYDESINFVICNGGVSATTCTVTNAPATVDQMYFMVTAFNSYGSASATSTAIPTVKAPTVPQNLWLSTEDSVTFSATWDEVSNANSYHAQVYKLVRSAQVPGFVEVLSRDIYLDKNTRTFSESGVSGNPDEIGFYVKVRAVGNGLYSDFAESFPVDY